MEEIGETFSRQRSKNNNKTNYKNMLSWKFQFSSAKWDLASLRSVLRMSKQHFSPIRNSSNDFINVWVDTYYFDTKQNNFQFRWNLKWNLDQNTFMYINRRNTIKAFGGLNPWHQEPLGQWEFSISITIVLVIKLKISLWTIRLPLVVKSLAKKLFSFFYFFFFINYNFLN